MTWSQATLLLPDAAQLLGWAGVLFAALVMIGLGRLLSAGRAAPEVALVAGWGAAVLLLTLWGIATPVSLRIPGGALAAIGLMALVLPRLRLPAEEWRAIGRILAVAAPLLVVMASAWPSQPDTFLNLQPNAAYLWDHGGFPADDRPPAYSFLPGAPYSLQLAAFMAGLPLPDFPASAMIGVNVVLLLAAALLLARLVGGGGSVSWGSAAAGLLLTLPLNPGFQPNKHLSAYSETGVTVTLAMAGWLAASALDALAQGRAARDRLLPLALVLAALVTMKQDSVALAGGALLTAGAIALVVPGATPRGAILSRLAVTALPAVMLYLAWRWYVLGHFAVGELKPMALAQWHWHDIPHVLLAMARIAGQKIGLFGALLLAAILLLLRVRGSRRAAPPVGIAGSSPAMTEKGMALTDPAMRAAVLLLGVFVIYNGALVAAYIGHFPASMGSSEPHSYFRYITHLSVLLMAVLVLFAGPWLVRFQGVPRPIVGAIVVAALVFPIAFMPLLRFDLEEPQLRARALAAEAAPLIADGAPLALLLPGDNGSLAPALETLLRTMAPRRPTVALTPVRTVDALAAAGLDRALLSCAPGNFAGVPAGAAALIEKHGDGWHALAVWPYAAVPRGARWSQVLSAAPLCLPG